MEHPALPPKYLNGDVCFLQFNKNTYLAKCSCLVCFSGMQCKFGVVVIVLSYQQVVGCGSPCNLRCGKLEAVSRQNLGPPSPQPATDTIITLSTVAAINTLSFSLA